MTKIASDDTSYFLRHVRKYNKIYKNTENKYLGPEKKN